MWDLPQRSKKSAVEGNCGTAGLRPSWSIGIIAAAYEGAWPDGPRGLLAANLLDHSGEMLYVTNDEHALTPLDQPGPR